jgi:hypothetical protein
MTSPNLCRMEVQAANKFGSCITTVDTVNAATPMQGVLTRNGEVVTCLGSGSALESSLPPSGGARRDEPPLVAQRFRDVHDLTSELPLNEHPQLQVFAQAAR